MADFDFGDGLRKVFLAGVGALATTVEKSQEIVDDLVKKGELTVEQGKALNAELKHKVAEVKESSAALASERPDQPGLHDRTFSDQRTHRPLFSYTRRIAFRTSGPEHGRRSDTGSDLCRRDPVK